jgi:SAM-dependent methyltransferase
MIKINYGCGQRVLPGYYNVDAVLHPDAKEKPQLIYAAEFDKEGNLIHKLPLDDGCASELMAIHVFEHFYRYNSEAILKEWHRLLKTDGLLILELPDLIKCCQNILMGLDGETKKGKHPDQLGRWGLYGDPRLKDHFMTHPWGWAPRELMRILKHNGFKDMVHKPTQFHPAGKLHRDMRIEARKA